MFHAAAFLHIIPYKTQSAKLFDRPCLLRGVSFIQCFDLFANLNIGFTFLRCFAGKEIQNINTELEITAIEQFNAIKRELFTTAWRLADTYKFPDQYRLTEKQIKQYNIKSVNFGSIPDI